MTTLTTHQETSAKSKDQVLIATGPASAAMVSSSIGIFIIGLMTTLSAANAGFKEMLNWWSPAGSLVGKTTIGVLAWLISWAVIHTLWKNKEYEIGKAFKITLFFISLGLLLTFPPIFEAFEK